MRKTNQEKWDELINQLNNVKKIQLYMMFNSNLPKVLYTAWWDEIREEVITEITIRGENEPRFWNKKPTNADIKMLKDYIPEFEGDEKKLYVHCYTSKYKASYKLEDITLEKNRSFSKEDLIEIQKKLHDEYAPREGYQQCGYCGKQRPIETLISKEIYKRGFLKLITEKRQYCSNQCAAYDQMAQEG